MPLKILSHLTFIFDFIYNYMNIYSYIKLLRLSTMETCEICTKREENLKNAIKDLPKEELLYDLAEFFKIFGDSSRILILSLLQRGTFCVSEISSSLNLSPSAVSHQLRILRQARLVRYQKQGKEVFYELDDEHIKKIIELGLEHLIEI